MQIFCLVKKRILKVSVKAFDKAIFFFLINITIVTIIIKAITITIIMVAIE